MYTVACLLLLIFIIPSFVVAHVEHEVKLLELGGNVSFNCTHHNMEDIKINHWIIPHHLHIVEGGDRDGHIKVSNDSYSIHIHDITRSDLGDYFCYYERNGTNRQIYSKTKVWLYEPTILVIYRRNFILGGVLAGGFFILAVAFCCIDAFKWRPKEPLTNMAASSLYVNQIPRVYVNSAYDGDSMTGKRLPRCDGFVAKEYGMKEDYETDMQPAGIMGSTPM